MGTLNVRQHLRKAAAFPTSSSSRVDGMSGAVTHSSRTVDFAIPGPGRRASFHSFSNILFSIKSLYV